MPRIADTALWQRLERGQIDPVYLLFGDEDYLIQEYTQGIIERILGAAPRDFNCDIFQAESSAMDDVVGIACTLPMMASQRVVVLHGLQHLRKADWQPLVAYLEKPSASTVLICSTAENNPEKLPSHLLQQAPTIACHSLEGPKLQRWVTRAIEEHGYRMSADTVRTFLQEQEPDLHLLAGEIDKLCTYAGDTREIGLADVQDVCQTSLAHSVFALSDALGRRLLVQALTEIAQLLDQGEPPLVIFSMIVRHLRLLWSVKQLVQQRQDASRIAKTLRLPVTVCRQLATQSRQFPVARLQQLYAAALEGDLTFKSSNKAPKAILEGLVFAICAES